jgi:hypothetical protein
MTVNVARQSDKVHLNAGEEVGRDSSELRQTIQMSVAEMEDAIAIEGLWEVGKRYGSGHELDIECIALPTSIQTEKSSTGVECRQTCGENAVSPQWSRPIGAKLHPLGFHEPAPLSPALP